MTTKSALGRLQRVPLRDCWDREDTDFTPWLASLDDSALDDAEVGEWVDGQVVRNEGVDLWVRP